MTKGDAKNTLFLNLTKILFWLEYGPGFDTDKEEAFLITILFRVISNSTQRKSIL